MATEHHIDTFDLASFFQLHDLNRDGFWDAAEVEAIYGVHHVYSQKKSKDEEEHQEKATFIVDTVFKAIDKNNDGKITLDEFEAAGLAALPSFDSLGAEGTTTMWRAQFHNTPETQTDESYNHPEDIEHFAHHEAIERKEAEREAKFQGITVDEALAQHEEPAASANPPAAHPAAEGHEIPKKYERQVPVEQQDPAVRFRQAKAESESHGEWGSGEGGYKSPKSASEKMRKNLPYKERMQYKFRRNWGDF
ncbi:hypothetical protein EI94DRAFT_1769033 [Lactarius quietus]|nr:hypothetical protein EI94DRAFT_1769033 [Lactarius quietus]